MKTLIKILLIAYVVVGSIFLGNNAGAVSNDNIKIVDEVYLTHPNCDAVPFANKIGEFLNDDPNQEWSYKNADNGLQAEGHVDLFKDRVSGEDSQDAPNLTKGWAVTENEVNDNKTDVALWVISTQEEKFINEYGELQTVPVGSSAGSAQYVHITLNNDCTFNAWGETRYGNEKPVVNAFNETGQPLKWLYLALDGVEYPQDYTGSPIPQTIDSSGEEEEDDGFIRYDLGFSYDVSMSEGIKVINTTPDELTTSLASGIWQCYFIISKAEDFDDETKEDIYYLNSCDDRTEIVYHPPVELNEEYVVTLWLSHAAYGEYTYVKQQIKVVIQPYTGDTTGGDNLMEIDRCFKDTAPWIDVVACYKTLTYTLNIMTFGTFNFTGIFDWSFEPQCRDLEVLDSWLNLDNNKVCPAFSKEVRDTITPFIAILLGTIVITLVVRSVSPNNPHHFHKDI